MPPYVIGEAEITLLAHEMNQLLDLMTASAKD
jgi:hypothetical protein